MSNRVLPATAGEGAPVISIHRPQRRQDATSYVGIIVFVASWAMMFAALFMSYAVVRLRSSVWPPPGAPRLPVLLPLAATAVLALSSASLQRGLSLVWRGSPERYLRHLVATIGLGKAFLLMQALSWWSMWRDGLGFTTGLYGTTFYLLTCFHALHVLVGLGLLAWLLPAARAPLALGGKTGRLGVVTVYWHFVGVVWALMFVIVYLT